MEEEREKKKQNLVLMLLVDTRNAPLASGKFQLSPFRSFPGPASGDVAGSTHAVYYDYGSYDTYAAIRAVENVT